jgi:hypothetical protein
MIGICVVAAPAALIMVFVVSFRRDEGGETVIEAAADGVDNDGVMTAAAAAVTVEVVNAENKIDGKIETEDVFTFDVVVIADDVISVSWSLSVKEGLAPPFVTDAVDICDENNVERLLALVELTDEVADGVVEEVGEEEDVIDIVTLSV